MLWERLERTYDAVVIEMALTEWHDLVRTGHFAWGLNFNNLTPPHFIVTARGRRSLAQLSRDPANPEGYLRHVASVSKLGVVALAYLTEGLRCYNQGLHKAAAVMVGGAAESTILAMRDVAKARLETLAVTVPKNLTAWQIRTVLETLHGLIEARKKQLPPKLREEFEAYFLAFAQQIRSTRNDAGHPANVDTVTEEAVHASLLVFPQLARLSTELTAWIQNDMS